MKSVLKTFINEVLQSKSILHGDVGVRPNDGETYGACEDCGAEPGCNIDCKTCMSLDENNDPEGPKDGKPTKLAACVLIVSEDGMVLAVSRKDDPTQMGLPGGKVDPYESPIEAAGRELYEETGLQATGLRQVFKHFDGDCTCYTFIGKISGEINTEEAGVVRWVTPEELMRGPFGDYNRRLFNIVNIA